MPSHCEFGLFHLGRRETFANPPPIIFSRPLPPFYFPTDPLHIFSADTHFCICFHICITLCETQLFYWAPSIHVHMQSPITIALNVNPNSIQSTIRQENILTWKVCKEYVASLIGLYKNNGAVSCAGTFFLLITYTIGHTDRDVTQILILMRFTHGQLWTRQLPIGAGHCQWGGCTDRNVCNIYGAEHLASRYPIRMPKIKPLGPLAAAGERVTDGRKEGKLGNI